MATTSSIYSLCVLFLHAKPSSRDFRATANRHPSFHLVCIWECPSVFSSVWSSISNSKRISVETMYTRVQSGISSNSWSAVWKITFVCILGVYRFSRLLLHHQKPLLHLEEGTSLFPYFGVNRIKIFSKKFLLLLYFLLWIKTNKVTFYLFSYSCTALVISSDKFGSKSLKAMFSKWLKVIYKLCLLIKRCHITELQFLPIKTYILKFVI